MSSISHRERAALALNHQQPDRVPIDFLGHASMLLDDMYFRLKAYLKIEGEIQPFRRDSTANYYDTRILDFFDVDFRRLFLPPHPAAESKYSPDGTFTDAWGIVWLRQGPFVNCIHSPLGRASLRDLEDYPWPEPQKMFRDDGLAQQAHEMFHQTDFALVARNPLTYGFLDRACRLRGLERFLTDLVENPEFAHKLIEKILRIHLGVYAMFLDAVGPYVMVVETGDDLGAQNNLIISPRMYREFIKPAQKNLNDLIREKAPHAKIFMHNDGAIYRIIPDLIEIGVEILNPVQPSAAGMESERLKKEFGDRLVFHGAVDQKALEGTVTDVRAEVRRRLAALAPGGGYILSTCNHIMDVPCENILAMFDEARSSSN